PEGESTWTLPPTPESDVSDTSAFSNGLLSRRLPRTRVHDQASLDARRLEAAKRAVLRGSIAGSRAPAVEDGSQSPKDHRSRAFLASISKPRTMASQPVSSFELGLSDSRSTSVAAEGPKDHRSRTFPASLSKPKDPRPRTSAASGTKPRTVTPRPVIEPD